MRTTITLLDGTELRVGNECRVQMVAHGRWRVAELIEIAQGTGVERTFVKLKDGTKIGPVSRYKLRPTSRQ